MTEEDFKDDPRGLSDWLKDKGNTHYKGKQFDEVGFWPYSISECANFSCVDAKKHCDVALSTCLNPKP
jgi:hypothetical protein